MGKFGKEALVVNDRARTEGTRGAVLRATGAVDRGGERPRLENKILLPTT